MKQHPRPDLATGPLPGTAPIAVTPHNLASEAALEIIDRGGSAVDAAIAADAVLGVVLPDTCGIGGDLFALVHHEGLDRPEALNASGRAGSGASSADLRDSGFTEMPLRHPATVTVPGCVDGWEALQARFGRLPLAEVLTPAIGLAENGFWVSLELSDSLSRIQTLLADQASAPPLYPGGSSPAAGDVLRRPRLARVLRAVADAGRDAFYAGYVADAIVASTARIITEDDLGVVQAEWVEPIGIDVFGTTGWTIPPNSQGYLTLAAARILELIDPPRDPGDPALVHACIEAYRAVAWQRDDVVSEPGTQPHDGSWYLDAGRLTDIAKAIDLQAPQPWPRPVEASGGTAYLCVRDRQGMSVSFIQSNFHGIGSGISAGDTGVFLHNRGAGFNLVPGHANEWQPGHRPLHTLAPTLWTRNGKFHMALGTRGGAHQPQLLLQMLTHLFIAQSDGSIAQEAPRWTLDGFRAGESHVVKLEEAMPVAVAEGLRAMGHEVQIAEGVQAGWGPISLIKASDGASPTVAGYADPRVSTAAAMTMEGREITA